jgi:hypothetical protein
MFCFVLFLLGSLFAGSDFIIFFSGVFKLLFCISEHRAV